MTTPDAPLSMVRSEERLTIHTEVTETERVRLEKYIVSEERMISVTVRHEEVRLIREPLEPVPVEDISDSAGIREEEFPRSITLSEERVVVTTEVVPVERVWLRKQRFTEEQSVSDTIRLERVTHTQTST